MKSNASTPVKQRGAGTMVFALIILFALTLIGLFGARVGLLNEKMAGNDFRAQESTVTAEAGMNIMIQTLMDDFTKLCKTGICLKTDAPYTITGPVQDVGENNKGMEKIWSATATVTANDPVVINVVATGTIAKTVDGVTVTESVSQLTQQLSKTTLLNNKPASPLILKNDFASTGSVSIVSNPHGVNCGVTNLHGKFQLCTQPVSVWSAGTVANSDTFTTCTLGSFIAVNPDAVYSASSATPLCNQTDLNCHCVNGEGLSGDGAAASADFIVDKLGSDIVALPVVSVSAGVNFPDDLFVYVFGESVSKSTLKTLAQSRAGHYLTDCESLTKNSAGIYWVEGNCHIGSAGWITHPIFLVVENGSLTMTDATAQVFGVAYVFNSESSVANISLSGGFWYGGIIDDSGNRTELSNVSVIYANTVFDALKNNRDFALVAAVPGSWRDW